MKKSLFVMATLCSAIAATAADAKVEARAGDAKIEARADKDRNDRTDRDADGKVLKGYHNTGEDRPRTKADGTVDRSTASAHGVTKATDFIGMKVKNNKGEVLGSIEDLALDSQGMRVKYAVLSSGGVLGFRDRLYAIPLSSFQRSTTDDKVMIFDVDKEALQNTAGFVKTAWPEDADRTLPSRINAKADERDASIREGAGAQVEIDRKGKRDADLDVDVKRRDRDAKIDVDVDRKNKAEAEIKIDKD